jgi:hypothetical protein
MCRNDMIATAYRNAMIADAPLKWLDTFIVATTASLGSAAALVSLYVAKSALGINLMPGPSPLHDLLYWMVV